MKKTGLAAALVMIMVASGFLVTANALAVPASSDVNLMGWTLLPSPVWTPGDIKGYSEGDVVPVELTFTSNGVAGGLIGLGQITGRIAFEWGYGSLPTPPLRGFEKVVEYTWGSSDPSPPFNTPVSSLTPFSAHGGVTIITQAEEPLVQDGLRIWDVWDLTVQFTADTAVIKCGGLLYTTGGGIKGASFFPGSSLHVELPNQAPQWPHNGAQDLPINVLNTLTPPNLVLEKFCVPDELAVGDTVTFTIAAENTGEGLARLLMLRDYMYCGLRYVAHSTYVWTSADPTKVQFNGPTFVGDDPTVLEWILGECVDGNFRGITIPGTGPGGGLPISIWFLSFKATLVSDVCQHDPKCDVDNDAILKYTDDHCGEPKYACAECPFEIIKPDIEVVKSADLVCAAGIYEIHDGVLSAGDIITYTIKVTNPVSTNEEMTYDAYDPILAIYMGDDPSDPIMSGTLAPGADDEQSFEYRVIGTEPQPASTGYKFRNTVDVVAFDDMAHKVTRSAYADVKIYHPDLKITKEADRDVASKDPQETIKYTVTIENMGDVTLFCNVTDSPSPPFTEVVGAATLRPNGQLNSKAVFHFDFPVPKDTPCGDLTDTVTVDAEDAQGHELSRDATETVTIVKPQIDVTKDCLDPETMEEIDEVGVGQQVLYKIDVSIPDNECAVPLWFTETDSLPVQPFTNEDPEQPALPVVAPGDPLEVPPDYMAPGDHDIDYYLYTLRQQDIDEDGIVTNTIYIEAWWNEDHPENHIHAQASCDVKATAKITGHVYYDADLDDGSIDWFEDGNGLGSWTVELFDSSNNLLQTQTTQSGLTAGLYEFTVLPGSYYVRSIIQPGWFSTRNESVVKADCVVFTIAGGGTHTEDYGNALLGSITGTKWYDWNLNTVWDDSEIGINGWHITLTGYTYFDLVHPITPITVTTGPGPIPPTMDGNGYWAFTGLYPGIYTVTEENRPGWTHIVPVSGQFVGVEIDENQGPIPPEITCCKFGNVPLANICGHKFYDKNMDGIWNDQEPALSGWTILLQNNSVQWPNRWVTYASKTTDSHGFYEFTGVKPNPGVYRITEVKKSPEWVMTTDPSTLLITFQKPKLPDPPAPDPFPTIFSGRNIGNILMAKIEGVKFHDKSYLCEWPNGEQDHGESGLAYWTITLQGRTITGVKVDMSKSTSAGSMIPWIPVGYYNFSVLPGTYWVNETVKAHWTPTTPISNMIVVVAYPLDQVKFRIDFGNALLEIDPELPFVLEKGTNLWSVPMVVPGLTAKSLLAAIGPSATSVTKLNAATGKLVSFMPNFPSILDFPIVPGEGYYVAVKEEVSFTLIGDLTSQTVINLAKGTNLIGYTGLDAVKASTLLGMVIGSNAKSITYLDSSTGKLVSYMPNFPSALDFDVVEGRAYFVVTDGPGTLTMA